MASQTTCPTLDIAQAFKGPITMVQPTLGYRVGILLGALFSALLPLIYVGLIAAVGYGLYHYVFEVIANFNALENISGFRAKIVVVMLVALPIIAGAMVLVIMLKPLIAWYPNPPAQRSLRREEAPAFFDLVEAICDTIQSPRPCRIDINCEVNASASFRHPLLSMIDNQLVLTVGLPLVAGLNAQQLAGILAHEFGHFSQNAGMRLTQIIRRVNLWLLRAVHERDAWDNALVVMSDGMDIRIGWLFYITRAVVWMTRQFLRGLLWSGQAASGFLMRQQEFDADLYGMRIAGSEAYSNTMNRVGQLSVAGQIALKDLGELGSKGILSDDLPWLILHTFDNMSDEVREQIVLEALAEKTELFDTHPSHSERITAILAAQEHGVLDLKVPATALFLDFEHMCRDTTLVFYNTVLDDPPTADDLVCLRDVIVAKTQRDDIQRNIEQFWEGTFNPMLRPMPWPEMLPEDCGSTDDLSARVQQSRETLTASNAEHRALLQRWDRIDDVALTLAQAKALDDAGIAFEDDHFVWPLKTHEHRSATQEGIHRTRATLAPKLARLEQQAMERLLVPLALVGAIPADGSDDDSTHTTRAEVEELLSTAHRLSLVHTQIEPLRMTLVATVAVLRDGAKALNDPSPNPSPHTAQAQAALDALRPSLHAQLTSIHGAMSDIEDDQDAFPVDLPSDDAVELVTLTKQTLEAYMLKAHVAAGRLCAIGLAVEEKLMKSHPAETTTKDS
ncbi:MAG: M48 family metalloprotease [Myxococcota bacterium]